MKSQHSATAEIADRAAEIAIEGERTVYDGFRRYAVYRFTDREDGASPHIVERELLVTHRTAAVLPVDAATGELVLLRQFRIGAHVATGRGVMIEIPAGALDGDEPFETAAARELTEETGLTALSLERATEFMPSPGMTNEHAMLFIAKVDAASLPDEAGTDHDERIFPFRCSLADALAACRDGRIANGFTLLALFWYAARQCSALRGGQAI